MARIGVFVCGCGRNIAATVDIEEVAQTLGNHPGVVHSVNYTYMCSDPGQHMMQETIRDKKLTGVLVAACSPQLHEKTFRLAADKAGLNPFLCEMANIREHCSWVHSNRAAATDKAIELSRMMISKLKNNRPLRPIRIPVTRRALVIGGGIAGIQAALDVARSGYEVFLVERQPELGGHMARLAATYPHFDKARFLLRPKIVELLHEPRIHVFTNSEVVELNGYVGNFKSRIQTRGSTTGDLQHVRPTELLPAGIGYPQPQEGTTEIQVGAVIPAFGFDLYSLGDISEYGNGRFANVLTSLQFEHLLRSSDGGALRRPGDGKVPREIVFVQCVRSRNPERGMPYCSRICCMYTAKQAMLFKQLVPDGQAYVFYIDIRAQGKPDEEFIRRAAEEYGVLYLRGQVSRIFPRGDKVMVWGADTLSGKNVEIPADVVVLALAMVPNADAVEQSRMLGISCDSHGFLTEAHPKLRPVETAAAGIFLAGTCQAPRDIAGTVAHASGAASKVLELFSSRELEREPEIARVDEAACAGCLDCAAVCPYRAISAREIRDRDGALLRTVAAVNEGICQGCGLCAATCRSKVIDLDGFTEEQVFSQIRELGRPDWAVATDASADPAELRPPAWEPKIVAFVCKWCTYAGADLAGTVRLKYPHNVRIVKLPCSGRIDCFFIVKALAEGADGVLVSGCHPGDCHYLSGNYHARRRFTQFRTLLDFFGVDLRRVQFAWVSAAEGAKWAELVDQLTEEVRALGPHQTFMRLGTTLGAHQ